LMWVLSVTTAPMRSSSEVARAGSGALNTIAASAAATSGLRKGRAGREIGQHALRMNAPPRPTSWRLEALMARRPVATLAEAGHDDDARREAVYSLARSTSSLRWPQMP